MTQNTPTRKGPKKVWEGYRNLRVPVELFDDVKQYLEDKKLIYLANNTDSRVDYSALRDKQSTEQLTKILIDIQQKLSKILKNQALYETPSYYSKKLTAKKRVELFLKTAANGKKFTTGELAEKVGLPETTCRQAARDLANEDPEIYKIEGRPNKYYATDMTT